MKGVTLQNRYRIESELGHGGMGVVYRAHDTLLDRAVAVKVLSDSGLGTEGRARLLREAQAAAKLDHPNIVAVYDAGEAEDIPFIVMQLVEGQSLHDQPPQALDEILAIARQICLALEHAHAHGIIHRDLKPENILVTRLPSPETGGSVSGDPLMGAGGAGVRAKLMDFGLARSTASRLTAEGALVGTVFYLAPEQALGQEIDGRADLYSLGVVLYELVARRLPFTGDDPLTVISQHLYAPVVPPSTYNPEIPPALDALLLKLLAKDPADRFASAAEARQALESLDRSSAAVPTAVEVSPIDRIARGRLVAREHELAEATAHWRRAVSGEGGVLLISGEPGIGKTRLVRELVTQARITGAQAFIGECYAEGGAPYAPIAQLIQAVADPRGLGDLAGLPPLVLADLLTLAPDLRVQFPDAPPNPPLDPQAEQRRLFESVVKACAALAERQPLLLVIDDAHWADSGTLFLLRHLARRVVRAKHPQASPLRVLIVLTYREVELDEARALNEVLLDFNRERLAARIKLTRLTPDQTRDLLAAMFQEEITPEFLDGIYRETEGNPFFIEEVCKALIEEGKVYREGQRWRRPGMDQIHIPQSVRVAIQVRVGRLPNVAQEALRMAALLGRKFDFETLQPASEQTEDELVGGLELAERSQLIQEVDSAGGGTFAFSHALIPAALSESLSGLRRRRLHRRAAAAIESLRPHDYDALAHHYGEAADDDRARAYHAQAGDRALATYANVEAEKHYRAALELGGSEAERAHSFAGLGETSSRQARYEEAIRVWREAINLYQSLGDYDGAARLYARSARAAWDGKNTPRGLALGREGLSIVAGQPESPGIAALLHETARACHFNGLPDEMLPLCREALAMAERVGDVQVQAEALTTLALSPMLSRKESLAALTQAIELAETAGLLNTAARAHNNLAHILAYDVGDLWAAHGHRQQAAALAHQMGLADNELFYSAGAAGALLWLADFAAVDERLSTLRKAWNALPQPDVSSSSLLKGIEEFLLRCRGNLDEAARRLRASRVELRQQGNLQGLWFTDITLADVLLETSETAGQTWRWEEVEEALAEAIALDDRGVGGSGAWSRGLLVVVRARQGQMEEAHRLLAEARVKAGSDPGAFDKENLSLAEARLAVAEARWPEALAAFEAAANLEARMSKRWHRAQTLREWAEAHLARRRSPSGEDEPGDLKHARERLQESLALFEDMNLPLYAARVRERLRAMEANAR